MWRKVKLASAVLNNSEVCIGFVCILDGCGHTMNFAAPKAPVNIYCEACSAKGFGSGHDVDPHYRRDPKQMRLPL